MRKLIALRSGAVAAALLAVLALAGAPVRAQDYPNRPMTLIVPFPPGGSTTIVGRIIADKMSEVLGQSIVVDNRGGAGGTIGSRTVAKSAGDGYTILLGYTGTLAIGPSLYGNVGYDPRTDFEPIGRIGTAPNTLVVHPSMPVHSVPELIAYAAAGVKITHVPYKGTGPAIIDLLGGHIPMAFAPVPATHENAKTGMLRMLAVTSAVRSTLLPEVPTIAEAALPGFEAVLRYGLVAPPGTPRPVIEKLNAALNTVLTSPDVRARLAIEGAEPLPSTPAEYAADIDREETQWSKVVKASGAKAE
jgi:tripartite-type tricarboxylate transporter receptor subunit TctC